MQRTTTIKRPRAAPETTPAKPAPAQRIILLSGEWWRSDSLFHLEATVFAQPGGAALGDFFWTNIKTCGMSPGECGTELVRGSADGMSLDLAGYQITGPLSLDHYLIRLIGDSTSGQFEGNSENWGDWGARLSGTYQIVQELDR